MEEKNDKVYKMYIRNDKKQPVGVVVALRSQEGIGLSFCNPKDNYNKSVGSKIAMNRLVKGACTKIPNRRDITKWNINDQVKYFVEKVVQRV